MLKQLPGKAIPEIDVHESPLGMNEHDDIENAVKIPQLSKPNSSDETVNSVQLGSSNKRVGKSLHANYLCFVVLAILQLSPFVFLVWRGTFNHAMDLSQPDAIDAMQRRQPDASDTMKQTHKTEMAALLAELEETINSLTIQHDAAIKQLKEKMKDAKRRMEKMQPAMIILADDESHSSPKKADATSLKNGPTLQMLVLADANFAKKYDPIFQKNKEYAVRHGYNWNVIGTGSKNCTQLFRDFFFRKHCMVAEWMSSIAENDIVMVFDSDVVPYRTDISLNEWVALTEDVVMYERIWNTEIAAGNYIVRNNHRARSFLMEWAKYEYEMPPGFSSADNGAIHLHVRRVLGFEDRKEGHCGHLYHNLTALVDNLTPYWHFVDCSRQNITVGRYDAADGSGLTLRLLGKGKAWVVDGVFDSLERDEYGPVFHHGVKIPFDNAKIIKYGLNATSETTEVVCGGHTAPNCTMCVINQESGEWLGESWCHGQCSWIDDSCVWAGIKT